MQQKPLECYSTSFVTNMMLHDSFNDHQWNLKRSNIANETLDLGALLYKIKLKHLISSSFSPERVTLHLISQKLRK